LQTAQVTTSEFCRSVEPDPLRRETRRAQRGNKLKGRERSAIAPGFVVADGSDQGLRLELPDARKIVCIFDAFVTGALEDIVVHYCESTSPEP
jgi:hypothetical protein